MRVALLCAAAVAMHAATAKGQAIFTDKDGKTGKQDLHLPYAFANDDFGFAVGYVYGATGYPQPQSSLLTTAIVGTDPSAALILMGHDLRLPGSKRLFLDPFISLGYYGENDVYSDGDPDFPNERAGSNDSDEDDFLQGDGTDNYVKFRFKYVLPFGLAEEDPITRFRMERGIPIDTDAWSPWTGGKTYVELSPFYRRLELDSDDVGNETIATNGLDGSLYWDNRDFFPNPTRGQSVRAKVLRDFGLADSSTSWTTVQAEIDQYFSLGETETYRQRVLVFDAWTSLTTTWDEEPNGDIDHGAPPFYGSTLGGLWRMRAYPQQRFNDKAAIYYSAELRLTPQWNPFTNWTWLQSHLGVQWIQIAPFVELGRVAPHWNLQELHHDMKWDAGIGLRAMASGLVVRIDTAVSDEGFGIQMMIAQPFQF